MNTLFPLARDPFRSQITYQLLKRWASQTYSNKHPIHSRFSPLHLAFLFLLTTYVDYSLYASLHSVFSLTTEHIFHETRDHVILVFVRPESSV